MSREEILVTLLGYFKSKRLNTIKLKISFKLINNFKEIPNKMKII